MKQLLLIRHAKSSWEDTTLDDLDRPLNNRGKKEAALLARLIKTKGLSPQLIISSPAKRARKTAKKIAKELKYPKKKIEINNIVFPGSVSKMVELIDSIDTKLDQVFIVGHSPCLLDLGNYLSGSKIEKLPTSGIILINFRIKSWKEITEDTGVIAFVARAR
ncbi:MAG: histidine phosphatase family protein [Bacteriovorax sp.]|nr:histidine phosphatase family protein [Bacteriovorax sp.]